MQIGDQVKIVGDLEPCGFEGTIIKEDTTDGTFLVDLGKGRRMWCMEGSLERKEKE